MKYNSGPVIDEPVKETESSETNTRQYRYVKRIIIYLIISILCFVSGLLIMGFIMLGLAAGYAFFSYVQRDKYATGIEEYAFKAWKKYRKNKKAAADSTKEQYKKRLEEIEKEFDFDYGDKVEFVCTDCNNHTKITYHKQKKVECPVCCGKMIPFEEEDETNPETDAEDETYEED